MNEDKPSEVVVAGRSQLWEQRPGETVKAYAAFLVYLGLGDKRSIKATAAKLKKNNTTVSEWSAKFEWGARVEAWCAHALTVERELMELKAREKGVEWVKRQTEIKEAEWAVHLECIQAARVGLSRFVERVARNATLADIARILEVASKLGRLSSGLATERTEVTGEGGGPLRVEFIQALDRVYGPTIDAEIVPDSPPPVSILEKSEGSK